MPVTISRGTSALVVSLLVLASAACGSSSESTGSKAGGVTTQATSVAASEAPAADSSSAVAATSAGGGGEGGAACAKDADRMSGSSTVMWTVDSKSEHKDSEATPATTMLFQADGTLKPSELTVKVGEVFTFGLAEGNTSIAAVIVGCSSGQTVAQGPALAAMYITAPGTYDISNELGSGKLGTVTVK